MSDTPSFFTVQPDRITLAVRVLPNSKRQKIEGLWNNTHLKIALQAPAVDGKANDALIAFLSKEFGIRKSDISLISGQTNRLKVIEITCDATKLIDTLYTYK